VPRSARLRVGGLTLAATSPVATPHLALPDAYRPFRAARGADIRLEYPEEPPPRAPREALLFESGGVWRVYRRAGGVLYEFHTPVLRPTLYKAVEIDARLRRGRLHFPLARRRRRCRFALAYPLDELLFQHRLALEGRAEVHAFGVAHRGRAALFCGESGAGKTTLARLWRRERPRDLLLSDDRVVLTPPRGGAGAAASGTPWHGEAAFASPARRRLAAIFFLRQAASSAAVALASGAAAARLYARSFPPPWDSRGVSRVLALAARTAASVPCFELRFRRDRSAVAAACEARGW
jgi:hypothetical protein